ncbi:MAG: NAD(P)-binding domain-containing protein [bacterium]|jgi:8-hydroxy-5-deazaflavin:NADPH oxidoreductase
MKKIGILGSGAVGQALGDGFIKYGHEVMIGTRSPEKMDEWRAAAGNKGNVGTFDSAATYGDIIVLACKGTAAKEVLSLAGKDKLRGKIIIDATNPIADAEPVNGVLRYFTTLEKSLMEDLQEEVPDAYFVKAFSSIGSHLMVNPDFDGLNPTMFICGNHQASKNEVATILTQFGFETEDMGNIEAARAIEPLAMLWCIPGFRENKWNHAFKLLKKS